MDRASGLAGSSEPMTIVRREIFGSLAYVASGFKKSTYLINSWRIKEPTITP